MKEAEELERQLLWAERLTKAEKSIVALVCGYYAGAMRSNGQPLGINKDVWVSLLGKVGVENPEQYL